MTNPEDVTSQSLVNSISNNKWVKARGTLIREYAIRETALRAADELEALILAEEQRAFEEGDPYSPLIAQLHTWVKVTRETITEEVA